MKKNIFLIQTNKPSRLIRNEKGIILSNDTISKYLHLIQAKYCNIYITSDEEIKVGDWVINLNSPYAHKELCRIDNQLELERYAKKTSNNCKKIILTTDQDLIKKGVQDIVSHFLEWFINNPSCEEVEIKLIEQIPSGVNFGMFGNDEPPTELVYKIIIPKKNFTKITNNGDGTITLSPNDPNYNKIIIPQEEPKEFDIRELNRLDDIEIEKMSNNWATMSQQIKPKLETLEEAAEKYCSNETDGTLKLISKYSFKKGAKWQQEQDSQKIQDLKTKLDTVREISTNIIKFVKKLQSQILTTNQTKSWNQ
jgi:hypothetical protein